MQIDNSAGRSKLDAILISCTDLLVRYFASRPEILNAQSQDAPPAANAANSNPFRKEITGAQAHVAAAAVGRASNSAAKYMSAGIKNLRGPSPNNTGGGGAGGGASGPEVRMPCLLVIGIVF